MEVQTTLSKSVLTFLCKVCNDGLPTKTRLEKSHVFLPQQCVFCDNSSESANHLFFSCLYFTDIYLNLHHSFGWPIMSSSLNCESNSSFRFSLQELFSVSPRNDLPKFAIIWWFIWFFRNKVIFSDDCFFLENLVKLYIIILVIGIISVGIPLT